MCLSKLFGVCDYCWGHIYLWNSGPVPHERSYGFKEKCCSREVSSLKAPERSIWRFAHGPSANWGIETVGGEISFQDNVLYCIAARPRGSDLLLSCKVYVYQQDLVEKELSNNARKVNFTCCLFAPMPPGSISTLRCGNILPCQRLCAIPTFCKKRLAINLHFKTDPS